MVMSVHAGKTMFFCSASLILFSNHPLRHAACDRDADCQ